MNRENQFRNYFDEYLQVCCSFTSGHDLPDVGRILNQLNNKPGGNLPPGTCLIDYAGKNYAYLSDRCQEIISSAWSEFEHFGLFYDQAWFHPDDRVIFDEQLFRDISRYLFQVPSGEIEKYRFTFTHRYYRNDGSVSHILQQGTFLCPLDHGIPSLNLLFRTDIGDFKTDNTMTLSVSYRIEGQGYIKVFSKSYPHAQEPVLSAREREIVRLSMEGLSSRDIAELLCLSIHTVKNHKRHMMEKTSTRSIAGLIHVSMKNNWI